MPSTSTVMTEFVTMRPRSASSDVSESAAVGPLAKVAAVIWSPPNSLSVFDGFAERKLTSDVYALPAALITRTSPLAKSRISMLLTESVPSAALSEELTESGELATMVVPMLPVYTAVSTPSPPMMVSLPAPPLIESVWWAPARVSAAPRPLMVRLALTPANWTRSAFAVPVNVAEA